HRGKINVRDITDGTSNTIMLGERSWYSKAGGTCGAATAMLMKSHNWPARSEGAAFSDNVSLTFYAAFGRGAVFLNAPVGLNEAPSSSVLDCTFGYASSHVGGVQFLLCDGSVRFISDTISQSPTTAAIDSTFKYLL